MLPDLVELRGRYSRWRRAFRRRLVERTVLRRLTVRDTVLAQLSESGTLLYRECGQGNFFTDPADFSVGGALVWRGEWDPQLVERACAILDAAGHFRAGQVFVNIGANIGVQVVSALRGGRFARAVAFEPEPANAALLVRNLAANALADRVVVERVALGDRPGSAYLRLHPRNKGAHSINLWPSRDGRDSIEVPVERGDAALARLAVLPGDIGLILIDVEGYEPEVMEGLDEVMASRVPVVIEFAPERYAPVSFRRFLDLLNRYYGQVCPLDTATPEPRPVSALAEIRNQIDVLIY